MSWGMYGWRRPLVLSSEPPCQGAGRVAEVDRHVGGEGEGDGRHLHALVGARECFRLIL